MSEIENERLRYGRFLSDMGGGVRKTINETDMEYTRTFKIEKQNSGIVFELRCPDGESLSVMGKNQVTGCERPYRFLMHCFDLEGREPDPATRINFKKKIKRKWIVRGWRTQYGEISKAGYFFQKGIYLVGDDVFVVEILQPGIDIVRVEVEIEVDVIGG